MLLERVQLEAENARSLFPFLGKEYIEGEGSALPRVMVVGDIPRAHEVYARRPIAGHRGVVLRQLIQLAGLSMNDCWLTNVLKYRTPSNRQPTFAEIKAFRVVLQAEWKLLERPPIIVALGTVAYMTITGLPPGDFGQHTQISSRTMVWQFSPLEWGLRDTAQREKIEEEWISLRPYCRIASG